MPDVRIPAGELRSFCAELAAAAGYPANEAALLARLLVQTDERGVYTHGVFRLPTYLRRARAGGDDPVGRPAVVREHGATAVVDAADAPGAIAGHFAMQHAIALASRAGTGTVVVRRSNHFGAAAAYALLAPPAGCIGIAMTNTAAVMAPWQGRLRLVGNNPIAIAAPAGDGRPPFVLDMALSQVANGKIRVAAAEGKAIPPGWAMDEDGTPTTDARAALRGMLAPAGAYKGSGLSIAVEILTAMLGGALAAPDVASWLDEPGTPQGIGQFFMAIDVGAFIPLETFCAALDTLLERVRGSAPAPGFDRVFAPGDLEVASARDAEENGVALGAATWRALLDLAAELRVTAPSALATT